MRESAPRPVALVAVALVLVLLFAPVPTAWLGVWHGRLLNFGHVPLFAVLVLALWVLLGPPLHRSVLLAIIFAGVVELAQPLAGRAGEWMDFLRGSLGALAGAAAIRAWESRRSRPRLAAYLALALALVVWPVIEVTPFVADTVEGRRAFPVLADFSTERELLRWECEQATLTRTNEDGRACGMLELFPGPGDYSFGALRPVVPDFRNYKWLCCAFRVVGGPVDLVTSVRTGMPGQTGTTHYQVERRFAEGNHVARLDLVEATPRARPEPLDLSDVRYVQLFAFRLREPRTILITRIWLEP